MKQKPGPKPQTPPPGHVTIEEAIKIIGPVGAQDKLLSYSGLYRHLGKVRTKREGEWGTIYIRVADLGRIRGALRKPSEADRRAIAVRAPAEHVARWEQAILRTTPAGEEPMPVSRWLQELANRVCEAAGL